MIGLFLQGTRLFWGGLRHLAKAYGELRLPNDLPILYYSIYRWKCRMVLISSAL